MVFDFFKKKQQQIMTSEEYDKLMREINRMKTDLLKLDTDVILLVNRSKIFSAKMTKSLKEDEKEKDIYKGVLLPE